MIKFLAGIFVCVNATRIFSGSVEPALLIASTRTMNAVNSLAGTSDRSLPPECFLNSSFTLARLGTFFARSKLKGDLVITPSASLPIVDKNVGSTYPAF